MNTERRLHWEKVYETKQPDEISWTQAKPQVSLDLIHHLDFDRKANIIDIGGGDSKLVDHLLDEGFENITVLDISSRSLERAKLRLGQRATRVKWIISDVTDFKPVLTYD